MSDYHLAEQVGFLLRRANQRHTAIFSEHMAGALTPTQFAAMAGLLEAGEISQNELGRQTAMDVATIKGVADRLRQRGLLSSRRDPDDQRRILLRLTDKGRKQMQTAIKSAREITLKTLAPLTQKERDDLLPLLQKLG